MKPSHQAHACVLDEEARDFIYHLLFFHYGGYALCFILAFTSCVLTGNHLITGGIITLFAAEGILSLIFHMGYLGLHFRSERRHLRQYIVGYGLYLLLAVLLAGGWVATRMTERHLYTALGMFIYIASPWIWNALTTPDRKS